MNTAGLLILLGAGLALAWALGVAHTVRMLTRPPRRNTGWAVAKSLPSDPAEAGAPSFETWTFRSRGLDLPAWEVPGECPDGPVIIITPGWGESRAVMLRTLGGLGRHASRVILWDPPGHGEAPGRCSLGQQEPEDLLALVRALGFEAGRVVLYGFSLGAGVCIAAAARDGTDSPIAAVIAEAPYRAPLTPARNVMRAMRLPHALTLRPALLLLGLRLGAGADFGRNDGGGFDRAAHSARLRRPLLVLHGERDAVSPPEDGERIAGAAPQGELCTVPDADHLDLWSLPAAREQTERAVADFLSRVRRAEPVPSAGAAPLAGSGRPHSSV